ncbi:MAG TPA: ZIP family metal transporter [bacterium]|nr:ZIP family metal transporter [bacterium]
MTLFLIIVFTVAGSLGSVGVAGLVLLFKERQLANLTGALIPYAIGALLGAAFFGMIPHAMEHLPSDRVLPTVLFGIMGFYLLEKVTLWRHCHEHDHPCPVHTRAGSMILIGDAFHNFVDGVAIGAAFLASIPVGITTAVAVIAHEVPQEVGDFAILLENGYSRPRALAYNLLSSAVSLPGALAAYYLLPLVSSVVPYLLAIAAASFLYIALADLVPGRRVAGGVKSLLWEIPLILTGMLTVVVIGEVIGH